MCYNTKLSRRQEEIRQWAAMLDLVPEITWRPELRISGFSKPITPIIAIDQPKKIIDAHWGFTEAWNGKEKIILNARNESIHEKKMFLPHVSNRCLILVNGFYEWKWLDGAGKKKEMYLLEKPNQKIFMLEGLYRDWLDKSTGELQRQYVILTKAAKGIMNEIHNSKHRMPVAYFLPSKWQQIMSGQQAEVDFDFLATAV